MLDIKVTMVSCNEKNSVHVKGKQPKGFKTSKSFLFLISWTFKKNVFWKKISSKIELLLGPPQVKCQLLISSIFDAMNF